jgi:nucleotide-binding universal stress UspA family protein
MKQDIVVVGTDGSDQSFRAVEWAASEAVLRGATLRIVSVPMLLPRMSRRKGPQGTPRDRRRHDRQVARTPWLRRQAALLSWSLGLPWKPLFCRVVRHRR